MFRSEKLVFRSAEVENQFEMSQDDFRFFSEFLFKLTGIAMTEKKRDLVSSRLRSYILKANFKNVTAYRETLQKADRRDVEIQKFINLMTTNKTEFFREPQHFKFMNEILIPQWQQEKKTSISVWSAASSTGEEPYSIAMALRQNLFPDGVIQILATDIDTGVLARARNGVYPLEKISSIPQDYHAASVRVGTDKARGWFKVSQGVHDSVQFQPHNLNCAEMVSEQNFDLIFCRNVMMYFTPATTRELIEKLHRSLKHDGVLFIGHAESIQGFRHLFENVQPAIYRKK